MAMHQATWIHIPTPVGNAVAPGSQVLDLQKDPLRSFIDSLAAATTLFGSNLLSPARVQENYPGFRGMQ